MRQASYFCQVIFFLLLYEGEWETRVYYDNEEVTGSPQIFKVFDTSMATITGLEPNSSYQINQKISFKGFSFS